MRRRVPTIRGRSEVRHVQPLAVPLQRLPRHDTGCAACGRCPTSRTARPTIKNSGKVAHQVMPRVSRVAALLKRWLLGTHQGAGRPSHLDCCLDESAIGNLARRRDATALPAGGRSPHHALESGTSIQRPSSRIDCWLTSPGRVMSIASWIPTPGGHSPRAARTKSRISK